MAIQIRTNAKELASLLKAVRLKLKSSQKRALTVVANQGKMIAKSLAPQNTGRLKKGIFTRVFNDRAEVISMVNTSFPYNLWVNATPPFAVSNFKTGSYQPFFRVPQAVRYGMPAITPSGNPVRWTGKKGFFDETARILTKRYGKIFDFEVKNILTQR